jgi:uncharacterized protein (UPF0332 family)
MDDEISLLFNRALESIDDSILAIENERYNMAANRSYYAIFYVVKALLLKKGIITKTHSGTIQKFGLEYVVHGDFDGEIAKFFSNLEDYRENSDYDVYFVVTSDEAIKNLKKQRNSLKNVKNSCNFIYIISN